MSTVACTICGEILTIGADGHACNMPQGHEDRLRLARSRARDALLISLHQTPGSTAGVKR